MPTRITSKDKPHYQTCLILRSQFATLTNWETTWSQMEAVLCLTIKLTSNNSYWWPLQMWLTRAWAVISRYNNSHETIIKAALLLWSTPTLLLAIILTSLNSIMVQVILEGHNNRIWLKTTIKTLQVRQWPSYNITIICSNSTKVSITMAPQWGSLHNRLTQQLVKSLSLSSS